MTYDRAELSHETLTNLPLRLETVLLAPVASGHSSTPSGECLPAADCSGLPDGDYHHGGDHLGNEFLERLHDLWMELLRSLLRHQS